MSNDTFTEVTSESWFGRIGGAFKGIVFGLILVVAAFPLHFWNEGRAVQTYKTLKEGAGAVVTVSADHIDPVHEGKLVHLTAMATADQTLTDPTFNVSAKALKLRRRVQMYQWDQKEKSTTRKKLGGGQETTTEYSYTKTWADSPINSSEFKRPQGHENPGTIPYDDATQVADPIHLGAFRLSQQLVRQINNYSKHTLDSTAEISASLNDQAKKQPNGYYIGANPSAPQVGDVRVTFETAPPTQVSVIAQQAAQSFEPYLAQAGGTIEMLETGTHTAQAMIQAAQDRNTTLTWILRGVGFMITFIGLNMIFRPLSVFADVIPLLGNVVGAGTGIIAFLVAATLSLITISIAWIVYRPVLGIALIGGAVFILFVVIKKMKGHAKVA